MIKNVSIGVMIAITFLLFQIVLCSLNTNNSYVFYAAYPGLGNEQLEINTHHGKISVNRVIKTPQGGFISQAFFNGFFIRFKEQYYSIGKFYSEHMVEDEIHFRRFFIDDLKSKEALFIAQERSNINLGSGRFVNLDRYLFGTKVN